MLFDSKTHLESNSRHQPRGRLFPLLMLFSWVCFALVCPLEASWRSDLYPENWQPPNEKASFYNDKIIQDFSYAGYKRGEAPLPTIKGPIFDVTKYGADRTGAVDSSLSIRSAIDAAKAAGGGVVYLPAGTYTVSKESDKAYCLLISSSNIVLRGDGAGKTFLRNTTTNMRFSKVIRAAGSYSIGAAVKFTADINGPTRRLPVATPGSFSVGDSVVINWSFTNEWIAEHNQKSYWSEDGNKPRDYKGFREVVAVNVAQGWIEIDIPTRYSMKVRDNARVSKVTGQLTGVGIESLSIGNLQNPATTWGKNDYKNEGTGGYEAHQGGLIYMYGARDCWISGVKSYDSGNSSTCHMLSSGIWISTSSRITVKECWMGRPQYGGGGGNGYMYTFGNCSDCLVQSCTADFSRHGFSINSAGSTGNVFWQCDDRNTKRQTGSDGSDSAGGSGSDNHMYFSHSNLWDGCNAYNSFWSAAHRIGWGAAHGLSAAHSVYWNTSGSGSRYKDIVESDQGRYGYVIGTSGSVFGVKTTSRRTDTGTAPLDHTEGIGKGKTLTPQSLYADQLKRRLAP